MKDLDELAMDLFFHRVAVELWKAFCKEYKCTPDRADGLRRKAMAKILRREFAKLKKEPA